MKMYSIAVAVNLDHSGTQNVALVWNVFVFCFLSNLTREFMRHNYRAEILAQFFHVQGMSYSTMFETQ